MIRILHLTSSFGLSGGAETNLLRLVCSMDSSRFRNTVATMTDLIPQSVPGLLEAQLANAEVPVYSLHMRRGVPSPMAAARLFRIVRRVRPQILQSWMYHADLLGLLVGKLAGVPAIAWNLRCSSLDMAHYRLMSSVVRRVLVPLSRVPEIILANSYSGIRFHEQLGYLPKQWLYVSNLLDVADFRPSVKARKEIRRELRLSPDTRLIGLIARFHPIKDHGTFIAAASILANEDASVHFVLAGIGVDYDNAHLKRLVEATPVRDRFHLLGQRHDVNRVTAALDVACSSSISEGSSNSIAEAMACGVPCVVTDVGDSAFIVRDSGKVVPAKHALALATACRELLDLSTSKRRELGVAARLRVQRDFSMHAVAKKYERVYEHLISRANGATQNTEAPVPLADIG
jgi:glycosyltransferase involved in cell wall biosynthesis